MALACSKCSTENADGALVCRNCGAPLPPPASWSRSLLPEDDQFDPLSAPTLVMQHTAPAALPPIEESLLPRPARRSGRRLLPALVAGVVLVAAAVWLLRPDETASEAAAPAASAVAPAASMAASRPAAAASVAAAASAATIVTPASAPMALPVASAVATTASPASAAPASVPASATEGRKRIPEPVSRKRAQATSPAASVAALPVAPAPEPVAPPPPAPERPKTVAELCAGGNLITRGFCEQRECRRSEHANDPVCAKLKDAEQRRLFQQ
ncbi:MAG: zinc ribbon domain-containing protein [Piscinibacter sp.]